MRELPNDPVSTVPGLRPGTPLGIAFHHVCASWCPVSPQIAKLVRLRLSDGSYSENRRLLHTDLKRDLPLFLLCVRELVKLSREQGAAIQCVDPYTLIHESDLGTLSKILASEATGPKAVHSLTSGSHAQINRLVQPLVSATVAEVLSDAFQIDPQKAYTTALLRQLGLALIAWNYPTVYAKVLSHLKPTETIDQALHRRLGFSPGMLGITIAQQWNLSPELRYGMGDHSVEGELTESQQALGKTLRRICKMGEALTRASDPEGYPTATANWEQAEKEIEDILGTNGFRTLRRKIAENCATCLEYVPPVFRPTGDTKVVVTDYLFNRTTCPTALAERLREFHFKAASRKGDPTLVRDLCLTVVPASGFTSGCIYLADPTVAQLVPLFAIGTVGVEKYESIRYSPDHPIARACKERSPHLDRVKTGEREVSYIVGSLGSESNAGVIYVELTDRLAQDSGTAKISFEAIRQMIELYLEVAS